MEVINEEIYTAIKDMGGIPRQAKLGSTNIFWVEKGNGQPLILLHGFDSCFYTWRHLFSGLRKGVRIIALDLPGFGLSGDAPEKDYSLEYFSKTIQIFLDHLGLKQVFLAGHSYGGLVCQDFVARTPGRIKGVALIASTVAGAKRPEIFKIRNLMLYGYENFSALQPKDISIYRKVKLRTPDELKYQQRFPECYYNIKVERPCLIVWGNKDRVASSEKALTIARRFSNVSIRILEGVGHNPQEETPDRFQDILFDFFGF